MSTLQATAHSGPLSTNEALLKRHSLTEYCCIVADQLLVVTDEGQVEKAI